MRQIHFESDSGSNHSVVVESPSSFLSEPNRGLDNSIQKPTVSRPAEPSEDADDGIEFVEEIRRNVREDPGSPESSVAIPAAQPRREADSASQDLTPRLTQSPSSIPFSQDLLSTSPFRDPDSQSHRFVECFQTQDLVTRTNHSLDETTENPEAELSTEIISSKLELSAEFCSQQSPLVRCCLYFSFVICINVFFSSILEWAVVGSQPIHPHSQHTIALSGTEV
jgi:hypothetical protein